jgi:putative signal transducing protein
MIPCETSPMASAGRLVEVFETSSVPEAEVVRSRLEDEGIPVLASGTDSPYRMGPVHLLVPAEFEVQARIVLASALEAPIEDVPDPDGTDDDAFEDDPEGRGGSSSA